MRTESPGTSALRALTRLWPALRGTGLVAHAADLLRRSMTRGDSAASVWRRVAASSEHPAFELDLLDPWQRRVFYCTPSFGRYYLNRRVRWLLDAHLHPGGSFLDIGANLGFYALAAAARVAPHGSVHAFEPQPAVFRSLERSAQLCGGASVHCWRFALSSTTAGEMEFHISRDFTSSSLRNESPANRGRYESSIRVPVASIDDLVASGKLDLPRLELAKIDVEGEEAAVVEGMLGSLGRWRSPPLFVEVRGPRGSTRAPDTFRAVASLLQPLGYRAFRIVAANRLEAVGIYEVEYRETLLFKAHQRP